MDMEAAVKCWNCYREIRAWHRVLETRVFCHTCVSTYGDAALAKLARGELVRPPDAFYRYKSTRRHRDFVAESELGTDPKKAFQCFDCGGDIFRGGDRWHCKTCATNEKSERKAGERREPCHVCGAPVGEDCTPSCEANDVPDFDVELHPKREPYWRPLSVREANRLKPDLYACSTDLLCGDEE